MALLRTLALSGLALSLSSLRAEEGMWTFDHPPLEAMQTRYGFSPDQAWLDHVRLSALRFPGGSGSFISADGLVLTNHHVGHSWIQKVSTPGHNLIRDGFLAPDRSGELPVPGLELRCLVAMEDQTRAVGARIPLGATEDEAAHLKKEAVAELLRERNGRGELAWEAVDLYQGGETWLYGYRVFRDVRLVMAPEFGIAAFGGDWDNFSYPRHDLDFALFRVYEKGQPYHPAEHLAWSRQGIRRGGMTFTIGHPGRTSRLETLAQMSYLRDVLNPMLIRVLEGREATLKAFARRGPAQALEVSSQLLGAANSLKVFRGETEGLHNPTAMARIRAAELELRAAVHADARLAPTTERAWETIQATLESRKEIQAAEVLLHHRYRSLLRGPLERALQLWRRETPRSQPLDIPLETALLAQGLSDARTLLGPTHPLVEGLLEGLSPEQAAGRAIADTRLGEAAYARSLETDARLRETSRDPLLRMARLIDPFEREIASRRDHADATLAAWNTRIARARFAVRGKVDYPDATFTLRLSYGSVQPCPQAGTLVQPFTTFGGLFDRADSWGPEAEDGSWHLPERWQTARSALNLSTPYNFISSNDIIGGNSGSPVVDRNAELVGLAFDGNITSLPGRYYYDGELNRCVSVDARGILEALSKVYRADALVAEITGGALR
nr:S46 family peptidase [uncultured Holophaga sp.]